MSEALMKKNEFTEKREEKSVSPSSRIGIQIQKLKKSEVRIRGKHGCLVNMVDCRFPRITHKKLMNADGVKNLEIYGKVNGSKINSYSAAFSEDIINFMERVFKLLANRERIEMLLIFNEAECQVSQVGEKIGLAQSSISQHLNTLRKAKVVHTRREAQKIFYSLSEPKIIKLLNSFLQIMAEPSESDSEE